MDYRTLELGFNERIATLTLTRGDEGNLIDARCLDELAAAAEEIAGREEVSVVLLQARGQDFCRGWDEEFLSAQLQRDAEVRTDPFGPLARLACPVICCVQGRAASAGLELALAGDIRLAAADAVFSVPEIGRGLLPLAGATQRLPRIAGRATALSMLLFGEELDAAAAMRTGLVTRVLPRSELEDAGLALAGKLASRGPLALRYAKEAVHRGLEMSLQQGLLFEADLSIILQTTADRAEGVRAFLEKRLPRFQGR